MALALYDRVQETTTTTGTGTITLAGAVAGFQSFAVVGNGNTTYYCITSGNAWEVGLGTYTSSGTTLARTTVFSNSSGTTSPISLTGTSNVFVTYPAERSINYDANNVATIGSNLSYSDTGIIASFASTVAGYNQVIFQNLSAATNASSNINVSHNNATSTTGFAELGINSTTFTGSGSFNIAGASYLASASTDLVLGTYGAYNLHFVTNSNTTDAMTIFNSGGVSLGGNPDPGLGTLYANNVYLGFTTITAAAGTTVLTNASSGWQQVVGTTTQTIQLPNATTLYKGLAYTIANNSTGSVTIKDSASTTLDTTVTGGTSVLVLTNNGTSAGTWVAYSYVPSSYDFSTSTANFGTATITNATYQGNTIQSGYGGTGLTTFTAANNALYSTSAGALAAGTLPVAAGGTGLTTLTANYIPYGNGTSAFSSSSTFQYNGTVLGIGSAFNSWSGARAIQLNSRALLYSTGTNTGLGYNFYYNGSDNIYVSTGQASSYVQTSGTHQWYYSTGGGSGGTVTFIEAMRITNNGGLAFNGSTNYGTSGQVLTSAGDAPPTWTTISGGGGSPAGSNTQIQYNNSGSFGASSNLVFSGVNLGVGGGLEAWSGITGALEVGTRAVLYTTGGNAILGYNFYYNGSNNVYIGTGYATSYVQTSGTHQWYYTTGGGAGTTATFTEAMRLDNSGNLGLGVTPNSVLAGYKFFQLGITGATFFGGGSSTGLAGGAYYSGNWLYNGGNYATRYDQSITNGQHQWYTAPSGTAGNAITFTQAMTLDNSGNLQIGATSTPFPKLYVSDGTVGIGLGPYSTGSVAYAGTWTNHSLAFVTNGAERGRFDTSGNLVVGSTTPDSVGSTTTITIDKPSGNGQLSLAANGTVRGRIFADNASSEFRIGNPTANPVMFYTTNTERMRITAAGGISFGATGTAYGTSGQVLTSAGDAPPTWTTVGVSWQTVKTANFTAVSGNAYPVNTTSGAITVTLPASPSAGNFVQITDYAGTFGTNAVTVNPNSVNLNGSPSNVNLASNRESIAFVYIDATQGWIPYSGVTAPNPTGNYTATFLIAGGGGAGGGSYKTGDGGAGGGAGGLVTGTTTFTTGTVYTVTVGAGAAGASAGVAPGTATNSSITGQTTAVAGGNGAYYNSSSAYVSATSGGSGGGAVDGARTVGSGTSGQGNAGGLSASATNYGSGGGGGSGGAGGAGSNTVGGVGGAGTSNSITGSAVIYAAGGGGGTYNGGTGGAGGSSGIGGAGSNLAATAGGNGTANTGSGGGGSGASISASGTGGNGGSGVVIISIPTANYTGSTTGSPTVTTSGSNKILTFTSSGSYTA
jgi:hypothetical protein